jgi:cytoplasmic iron level regulating protein YaaA (DUF328/UPF0246 family)
MITVLAPSKTMDFTFKTGLSVTSTQPHFFQQAQQLVDALRTIDDIAAFMNVSNDIAQKTVAAYENWGRKTNPAVYAYIGDVYKGFFAPTLSEQDVRWAQEHIRILSGLYGVLRPLDLVSGYRLEMKAKLPVSDAKNLYQFWGKQVAEYVDAEAGGVICVLSSDEYAKVVTAHAKSRIVTPVFLDKKPNGVIGTVPIYSKMMRGVMARWIIDHRINSPDQLSKFTMQGYSYDAARSTPDKPAFYREVMTPLRFY